MSQLTLPLSRKNIFSFASIVIFTIGIFLFGSLNIQAQYTILYNDASSNPLPTDDISVCQDEVFYNTARIIVTSNGADNPLITITFPPGVEYVPGCISVLSSSGTTVSVGETDISDLNAPVFGVKPGNLNVGDEFVIQYCRVADCEATMYQMGGGTFKDVIEICGDAGCVLDDNMNLNSYDLSTPSIAMAFDGPITADVGTNACRNVTLTNGGLGYLDSLKFYIIDGPGTATTSLTTPAGNVLTPVINGDTLCYWLDSPIIAEFGNGDDFLDNGEQIMLERCYDVLGCDNDSYYGSYWGCPGSCMSTDEITQQTNIPNNVPNLSFGFEAGVNRDYCFKGQNAATGGTGVIQTFEICNSGAGAATNVSFELHNATPGSGTGQNYFTLEPGNIFDDMGNSLGTTSNQTSLSTGNYYQTDCTLETHHRSVEYEMDGIVIAPGACITIEIPSYANNLTQECDAKCNADIAWYYFNRSYSYQDACEINNYGRARQGIAYGGRQLYRYDIEMPTDMSDCDEFNMEVQYSNFYNNTKSTSEGSTELKIDVSNTGLSYNGTGTETFKGIAIMVAQVGDTICVTYPHNAIPVGAGILSLPLKASCSAGGGTKTVKLWHEGQYDDNCPGTPYHLKCLNRTFVMHCPEPCPEGGATPMSFSLERTSLGLADIDNNGIPDGTGTANPADVNLHRASNCDTVKGTWEIYVHPNTIGPNAGNPFNHLYVEFNLNDLNLDCTYYTTDNLFEPLPDALATIYPADGSAPFTCMVTPSIEDLGSGTNNMAKYDLSSCKANWEGGDSITFCASYVVTTAFHASSFNQYVASNEVYSSYIPNPTGVNPSDENKYTCDHYDDYMNVYRHYFSPYTPTPQTINGCNGTLYYYLRYYINTQTGDVWYPNEYRNFTIPDKFTVDIDDNLAYRPGSVKFAGQTVPDADITQMGGQLMICNLKQFFTPYGGTALPSDETWSYGLSFKVDPTCDAEPGLYTTRFKGQVIGNGCHSPDMNYEAVKNCTSNAYSGTAQVNYDGPQPFLTGGGTVQFTTGTSCWDVILNNGSNNIDAPFTWFNFDGGTNYSVTDASGTAIAADANGFFQLGDNPSSNSSTYTVCAESSQCDTTIINLLSGWGCTAYPDDISSLSCADTVPLIALPLMSEVQLAVVNEPVTPMELCATQSFMLKITSAQAAFLDDPKLSILIPAGLNVSNLMVEYPAGSGNIEPGVSTMTGNVLLVDAEAHSVMGTGGMPGTIDALAPTDREVYITFDIDTDCDFISGSGLVFQAFGKRPCGDPAINNGVRARSADLTVQGASVPYAAAFGMDMGGLPELIGCTGSLVTVEMDIVGLSSTMTSATDSVIVTLDPGVNYLTGTFMCCASDPANCFTLNTVTTDVNGYTTLAIAFPAGGIDITNPVQTCFTYEVTNGDGNGCDEPKGMNVQSRASVGSVPCITAPGGVCPDLQVVTGQSDLEFTTELTELNINPNATNFVCSPTGEIEFDLGMTIDSLGILAGENLYVDIYCATPAGLVGAYVQTEIIPGPVAAGTAIVISGTVAAGICDHNYGIIAVIGNSTNDGANQCICETTEIPSGPFDCPANLSHEKEFVSLTETAPGQWNAKWNITVENTGLGEGLYNLNDVPGFDDDIEICGAEYSTDAMGNPGNPGTLMLSLDGIYELAEDQMIAPGGTDTYCLIVCVSFDPAADPAPGDGTYTSCEAGTLGDPTTGEGLYNQSQLDVDDDGVSDEVDEACADLPCTMSVVSAVPGDCNASTGLYDLVVTVNYGAAPNCLISVGGQTFVIDGSGSESFTVTGLTADGTMGATVSAFFTCEATCFDQTTYDAPEACSPLLCSTSKTDIACNGEATGTGTVTGMGGTAPYTYLWSDGSTTATASGLTAGSYTVTVTDDDDTEAVCNVTIEEPTAIVCSIDMVSDITCNGADDGTATVSASGGTPGFTYAWSTGETLATAVALVSGTNTVTVTDANDCTVTCSVDIVDPPALSCSIASFVDPDCNGAATGSITVTGTGGTGALEYSINGGAWQPGATFSMLTAGSHVVSVRDANECVSTCSQALTEPSLLECSVSEDSPAACGLNNGSATVVGINGTPGYSYAWDNLETTATAIALSAGVHMVTVTDDNDCTTVCSIAVSSATGLTCEITSSTNVSCAAAADGTATVTVMGGTAPYSYVWSNAATTASITGLAGGMYSVTIMDDDGCDVICMVEIEEPVALVCSVVKDTDISCNAANDGGATVSAMGGTPNYTYAWSNGETTAAATSLVPGTNTVTVTDANDCTVSCTVEIIEPAALSCTLASTPSACMGQNDGTVTTTTTGGTAPLTYAVNGGTSQTGPVFSSLAPGSYTVVVTDDNGCTTDCTVEVGITGCEFDLALIKQLTPGQQNPVDPGDQVSFTITVFNQGQIPADNIDVVDYVPSGFTFNPADPTNVLYGWFVGTAGVETTASVANGLLPAGGLAPGTDVQLILILDVAHNAPQGTTLTNYAEISDATDDDGNPQDDVDSDPDDDDSNDGPSENDDTDGTNGDEDDHDPEEIEINFFDLALTKVVTAGQGTSFAPGDNVDFTITVYNQGTIAADNIEVTDYVPTCMQSVDPDWTGPAAGPVTYTMTVANGDLPAGGLAPGGFAQVDITLQVLGSATQACDLTNWSEISGQTDSDGDPITDVDSTPDGDDSNDTYGGDDDTGNTNGDEDDHDPASIDLLMADLALAKDLGTGENSSVAVGQDITFTITIENQGSIAADNIDIVDYLDPCMTLNDTDWGGTNPATYTMSVANGDLPVGGLLPMQQATVDVTVTISCAPASGQLVNVAEIESFTDEDGNPLEDDDSTPDSDPDNDPPGEDDIDDEPLNILEFDLALSKDLAVGQSSQVAPGDLITYTISVVNQGQIAADNIEITDYVGACFTLADANWSLSAAGAVYTLSVANGDLPAGGLIPGATTTVDITLQLDNPVAASCDLSNVAEISDATDDDGNPQDDVDSDPDDDDSNDPPGEDDIDDVPVELLEFDLALSKDLAPGQSSNVAPGDLITYEIIVVNQGDIAADNIEVTDYIGACFTLADANWTTSAAGAVYTMSVANGDLPTGGLAAGGSASVQITLQLDNPVAANCDLSNVAEISGATDEDGDPVDDTDSDPDDDDSNDPPGEDDIDDVPVELLEFDLALSKDLAPGQSSSVAPGDLITYEISVVNQGDIAADNIEVTDYIGSCFTLADANWTTSAAGAVYTMTVANGDLPAGGLAPAGTATVQITLQLDNPVAANCDLSNVAEISGATDDDGDPVDDTDSDPDDDDSNDPPGEDDIDDVPVDLLEFDLALSKDLAAGQPSAVAPGDLITYDITVLNQGDIHADNIEVADYIPTCMSLSDANWSLTAGTAYYTMSVANGDLPAGGLAPMGMASVQITLLLNNPVVAGCGTTNVAEISNATDEDGMPQEDTDSDPDDDDSNDPPGEDDIDDEPIDILEFDLALTKALAVGQTSQVMVGDDVTFTFTVTNQGQIAADNIEISDYIPADFVLNDPNWTGPNPAVYTISVANGDLPTGGLLPGQIVTVDIILTVQMTAIEGNTYINEGEISDATDEDGMPQEDTDSDPDNDPNNDPPGEDDIDDEPVVIMGNCDLSQIKTFNNFNSNGNGTGGQATFDITVTNQGECDAYNVDLVDYILPGWTLSDAAWYLSPFDGNAYYTIAGPILPGASQTVTITFDVTSFDPLNPQTNWSEIAGSEDFNGDPQEDMDSDPDSNPNNDGNPTNDEENNANGDEDDHDFEDIQIIDLAIDKSLNPAMMPPYAYGDNITFDICVTNEGNATVNAATVTDNIPAGFTFNAALNPTWTNTAPAVDHTFAGPIAPTDVVCESIILTFASGGASIDDYTNVAEITEVIDEDGNPNDDDWDSTPDNDDGDQSEDDEDAEVFEVFDLNLEKIETSGGPYAYGDNVTFDIVVCNQGSVIAQNVVVEDRFPCGYEFISSAGWNSNGTTVTTTIAGPLAPSACETIALTMLVRPCASADAWVNVAEIIGSEDDMGNPRDDIDSDEDNDDPTEDDQDDEVVEIFDLAQIKQATSGPGPYLFGDYVEYTITVYNQGNVDASNISVIDYLPAGLQYNAAYVHPTGTTPNANAAWTVDPATGDISTTIMTGGSVLAPGTSTTVVVYLEVIPANTQSDWFNYSEISEANDGDGNPATDSDSDADNDNTNDGDAEDDEFNGEDNDGDGNPDEDDHDVEEIIVAGDVGDTVWKDVNGNGIQDGGEVGVAGVIVTLYDCAGNEIAQTTTDANGNYLFEQVIPGSYYINFDISGLPAGCDFTLQGQGTDVNDSDADSNGDTPCFDTDGTDYLDVDAGLLPLSGLGNYVWFDMDGDGIQDPGEPGIGGVRVDLYDQNGNYIGTDYTDPNGYYFFDNLYPDHYYVEFTAPAGYDTTMPNSGASDLNDSDIDDSNGPNTTASTWLDAGEIDNSWDAGFHTCVEIGDLLWLDTNNNGIADANENGVNGVKVELYKVENGVASLYDFTFTGHKPGTASDDGYWKFCAPPGEYFVKFIITSPVMTAVTPWQGTSDVDSNVDGSNGANTTASFNAISGTHRCDIDGGYKVGSNVTAGTIPTSTSVPFNVAGFTGTYQGTHTVLSFTATADDNKSHFVIERSLDGAAYAEFAKVLAKQTGEEESYKLNDYDVYDDGLYTYRLSIVDYDDRTEELDNVEIRVSNALELGSKLYPNPAVANVTLELDANKATSVKAVIVSASGLIVDSDLLNTTLETGLNVFNLDISGLTPGFYTIRVLADEKVIDKKLIVIGQ